MARVHSVWKHLRELGLTLAATEQDVRRAYRRLVMQWHPDRFADDPVLKERATRKMARLSVAYAALREHYRSRRGTPAMAQRASGNAEASATSDETQRHPARPWRGYPVWLAYACACVSAVHVLGYLGMVLLYAARPQASQDAAVFVVVIACFCILWAGYLFFIGVLMSLEARVAHEHLLGWCVVQGLAALLLAAACAQERDACGTNGALAAEQATTIALRVGASSAGYAMFLFWMRWRAGRP